MKYIFNLWLLFLLMGMGYESKAQNDVTTAAKTALKGGDSSELAKYFNNSIELIIESDKVEFDKVSDTQAELVLRTFFQKNPAKDFTYVHQGSSPEGLQYSTGTYLASTGSFQVYILMKQFSGKYLISKIQIFDKE
ncbi:MAG: DUF4783 domain-containing protein [Bacteroidota bacterium]